MSKNKATILLLTTIIVIATIGMVSGNPDAMVKNKTWNVIAGGQTKDMAIQGMAFYPGIIIVNVGDTIKWKIGGNFHTISFLSGQSPPQAGSPESLTPSGSSEYNGTGFVSSGILPTGGNYSLKFTEPGVFSYGCLIHPGMQGIVIVQPSGSKYPFTQKEYNNQGETDLQKDIEVGRELANKLKHMVTSSPGPDNSTMWKIFIDIPLPEMVKLDIKQMDSSHVKGKATLDMISPMDLNVKIEVTGLEPNSNNPSNIKIGTCDMPGSTVFPLGNIKADSKGKASFTKDIIVPPGSGIMNRGWIVSIDKGIKSVACGDVVKHDAAYMRFTPGTLTINQGDNVMWTQLNPMEIHTVSFLAAGQAPPEFLLPGFIINPVAAGPSGVDGYNGTGFYNSGILIPGASYNLTFTKPGDFTYRCLIHDEMKMMGEVVVLPPGGSISGIKTVVEFNATASEAPENLAVDDHGNIYVSLALTGEIKKVTPEGQVSTFAKLPSPGTGFMTGLTFDRSGDLYVAFASFDSNHGVWRVSKDGKETKLFAALTVNGRPDGLPNDLKFDKKGNLYVSDFIGGKVWKIDRKGIVNTWKADPLLMGVIVPGLGPISNFPIGANGLAFDQDEENLYVANTGLGRIVRIPVKDDGNAGKAAVFVENEPLLRGADGITFDEDGKLYVAVNFQDRIVVISQKGDTATLAEGFPLQNPADVLFGVRDQENNLYIANFAILRLLGVIPETPRPALLKMPVDNGDMAEHATNHYRQTNLVSDVSGLAQITDSNLVNSWGIAHPPAGPWWVADNGMGVSTLYNGTGIPFPIGSPLVVTIPPPPGGSPPAAPTGIVFNGLPAFNVTPGNPARFIFVTEDGTISAWNPAADPINAKLKVNNSPGAVYKGVTIAGSGSADFLYVANFREGTVDVFDTSFNKITLAADAFTDKQIPASFAPFNVQNINGKIFVTFAKQDVQKHDNLNGPGLGFVDIFDPDGGLLMRLKHGNWMDAPWGITLAPSDFGKFSEHLLVGNFGSGQIAAFDPKNGNFQGFLRGQDGKPVAIEGLWGLGFGNDANAGPANSLFFAAGINDEQDGLFGSITPMERIK